MGCPMPGNVPTVMPYIWSNEGPHGTWKTMTIGCCPFCRHNDSLCVSEITEGWDPPAKHGPQHQVACGCCGAAGPWGGTAERAIQLWSKVTGHESSVIATRPHVPPDPNAPISDDIPF